MLRRLLDRQVAQLRILCSGQVILSWKETCHEDIAKEEEEEVTEFSINFKFINYT